MGSDVPKGAKKKIIMKISLVLKISYGSKTILRKERSSFTDPKLPVMLGIANRRRHTLRLTWPDHQELST